MSGYGQRHCRVLVLSKVQRLKLGTRSDGAAADQVTTCRLHQHDVGASDPSEDRLIATPGNEIDRTNRGSAARTAQSPGRQHVLNRDGQFFPQAMEDESFVRGCEQELAQLSFRFQLNRLPLARSREGGQSSALAEYGDCRRAALSARATIPSQEGMTNVGRSHVSGRCFNRLLKKSFVPGTPPNLSADERESKGEVCSAFQPPV